MEDTIRLKLHVHRTSAAAAAAAAPSSSDSAQADDAEIRRLCLSRTEGFDGLARACAAWCGCGFALRYTDDEGDVVELQSQEEWAECLHLYDCGPRQPRPLLLSVEALPSSSASPPSKKAKKSCGAGKRRAVKLRFVNSTAFNVQVSWLRQNRPRVLYTSIAPQGVLCVNTFAGHVWGYAAPSAGIDGRVTVSRHAAEAEVVVALPQCAEPPPPPPPFASAAAVEVEEEEEKAEVVFEDNGDAEVEVAVAAAAVAEEAGEVRPEVEGAVAERVAEEAEEEAALIEEARTEAARVAMLAAKAEAEAARVAMLAAETAREAAEAEAAEAVRAAREAAAKEAAEAEAGDDLFRAFEASQAVATLKEVGVELTAAVKALVVKHKGQVDPVLNEIFD